MPGEGMCLLKRAAGVFVVITMISVWTGDSGCHGDFPDGPFPPEFPPLSDPIPYDGLAPGKIVFQRIGPPENKYVGAYIFDTRQKRALEMSFFRINDPSVSPDGERIAFTTFTTVPNAEDVYIVNNDATNRLWVSDIEGREQCPSWTFDGKQILFFSIPFGSGSDSAQLYRQSPMVHPADRVLVVDFGKRAPRVHVQGPVSMSSDGKLLVGGDGIWTISGDSAELNLLVPAPGGGKTLYSPAWSPDGKNVAALCVTRDAAGIASVAVVVYAADGTVADTVVTLPASGTREWPGNNSYSLCWSPDGSQIAFTRPDGKEVGAHIYAIGRDHTGLMQVTSAPGVTDRSLSWGGESPIE